MNTFVSLAAVLACASGQEVGRRNVVNCQGAGTSNPSKFYWDVMETIQEQAKIPVSLGYRAVGSSTGYKEFVGINLADPSVGDQPYVSYNNFGSGDIPIAQSYYDALQQNSNRTVMQLPFVAGAIAIFFNDDGGNIPELRLNPCTLAKIFDGQITRWDDVDIQALNADKLLPDLAITVVHRQLGSSSTSGLTGYLVKATNDNSCAEDWTLGTGSTINWPTTRGTFTAAQGSGGVVSTIAGTPGSIGYIDSGQGYAAGFAEIALQNQDGIYLYAKDANIGIATEEAINAGVIPTDPTDSWADVTGYNLPGPETWPISLFSYFFLDQDWTEMGGEQAGLCMYFIKYVLSENGQAKAVNEYGFAAMPNTMISYDLAAIDNIVLPADYQLWTEEASTQIIIGAGDYVISAKRKTANAVVVDGLVAELSKLGADNLAEELEILSTQYVATKAEVETLKSSFGGVDITMLQASLDSALQRIQDLEDGVVVSAARATVHAPQYNFASTVALLTGVSAVWFALRA